VPGASILAPGTAASRRVRGLLAAAAAVILAITAVSVPAQAAPGDGPGGLTLTPDHGLTTDNPVANFSTVTACPASLRGLYQVMLFASDGTTQLGSMTDDGTPSDTPPSGTLNTATLQSFLTSNGMPSGDYEIGILCFNADFSQSTIADDVWITVNLEAGTWQLRGGEGGAVATTTTVAASPTSGTQGADVTLSAHVSAASGDPAGSVEFLDGSTSLGSGPVSGGNASKVVNNLAVGTHTITATFTPTDTSAFQGSTSADPATVTITQGGGQGGTETINVNIPPAAGTFTFTVGTTSVTMTDATVSGGNLQSTGQLGAMTVSDGRSDKPGWSVSGSLTDFRNGGTNTIPANDLGWTPKITSTGSDATAGAKVTPGGDTGLKQGAALASATAGHGGGSTTISADLILSAPVGDTAPGSYNAVLSLDAIGSP
jgi:hypothetical protein